MTRDQWAHRIGYWCEILGIREAPRLLIVAASDIPECDAKADFDDARATKWTVKVRRGKHEKPDLIMCHELLHVRTGLTDAVHEDWMWDVAEALVGLARRTK